MTFSDDVGQTLVKSLVFGALVSFIATYRGYIAEPTSAGVSAATTQTVVISSIATSLTSTGSIPLSVASGGVTVTPVSSGVVGALRYCRYP